MMLASLIIGVLILVFPAVLRAQLSVMTPDRIR
jgi:Mg2+/Co2+ transporter CorB